jgi:hypothetical protein
MPHRKLTTTEKLLFAVPAAILALPFLLHTARPLDFIAPSGKKGTVKTFAKDFAIARTLSCPAALRG